MFRFLFVSIILIWVGFLNSASASVLPDDSPEQQYRYALSWALQNDMAYAEKAFEEFIKIHPRHERSADALFWLGRVQFMRRKFEESAMTFSEFNSNYQSDPRLVETTLFIAESVAQFASPEQACEVYYKLNQLFDKPTEPFVSRLHQLQEAASCSADNQKFASNDKSKSQTKSSNNNKTKVELAKSITQPNDLLLNRDDIEIVRRHISKCWSPPLGAKGVDNLKVDILLELNYDGTVKRAEIQNSNRFNQDKTYKVAAEAALRAVIGCGRLPFPAEKYESWKQIIFGFDPKSFKHIASKKSLKQFSDSEICQKSVWESKKDDGSFEKGWYWLDNPFVNEAKLRGLSCGLDIEPSLFVDRNKPNSSLSKTYEATNNNELVLAQRKAEQLEAELTALKAEQQQEQQIISNDNRIPIIDQLSANTSGKQGIVTGRVRDNTGIAELTVDGMVVQVGSDGQFEHRTFIPANGKQVIIEATDLAGLTSQKQISLSRDKAIQSASISFDSLNPLGKSVAKNSDALALVIGIASYENTPAPAIYADSDALMFRDYASEKLGIPENRIKTLVNDTADEREVFLSVKNWLARSIKQEKTDVYVFFAGHGLASDDGKDMYLLPYDGAPELLQRTAILRDELFSDIAAANPRSVTVFLDTCYSGTTRGTDMLIASRPIAIQVKQQNIPDGFTVFTAAGGDQTAKPLEEAKHGMFSYFLMKGMEGDADSNRDNQITAAELHEYVEQNVVQQSGGSQVPELQGDAERVLVRF